MITNSTSSEEKCPGSLGNSGKGPGSPVPHDKLGLLPNVEWFDYEIIITSIP